MAQNIRIVGLNKLIKRFDRLTQTGIKVRSLRQAGLHIAGWSKKYRLTGPRPKYLGVGRGPTGGRLRSSVSASRVRRLGDKFFTFIGTNVTYGRIHEKGGYAGRNRKVRIPARPFLQPAIESRNNRKEIEKIVLKNVNRALQKV